MGLSRALAAPIAAALVLPASLPRAQEIQWVGLPVDELVTTRSMTALHVLPLQLRSGGEDEEHKWPMLGEQALMQHEGGAAATLVRPALFDESALRQLLAAIAKVDTEDMRFLGATGTLQVDSRKVDAVKAALERVRRQAIQPIDVSLDLSLIDGNGKAHPILAGRERCEAGRTCVITEAQERSALVDFDVEIAQAASIADPVMVKLRTGASVVFRARLLPSGQVAVVEAVVRVLDPVESPPINPGHPGFGPMERLATNGSECGLSFRVRSGEPVEQRWTAADGRQMRLEMTARWEPRPPADTGLLLHSPLLNRPVLGFRFHESGKEEDPIKPESSSTGVVEAVIDNLSQHPAVDIRDAGSACGTVFDAGNDAAAMRTAIVDALEQTTGGVEAEIVMLDVGTGAAVDASAAASEGRREVARFSGRVLRGHHACFSSTKERNYLADWSVEVAQSARIPDPHVERIREGWSLSLALGPGGVALVDCDLSRLSSLETSTVALDLPIQMPEQSAPPPAAGGAPAKTPAISLPQDVVTIEKPRVDRQRFSTALTLDAQGVAMHRCSAVKLLGAGRDLVIVVKIK